MGRLIVFFIIFTQLSAYSQDRVSFLSDSLKKELSFAKTDSARGSIYLYLTSNFSYDFKVYEKYAKKAIKLCSKSNYRFGEAKGRLFYGYALIRRGAIDSSFEQYYIAEKIFEELKDTASLASIYIQIAGNLAYKGDVKKAIEYQQKTIQFSAAKKDTLDMASGYNMIATSYGRLGDYDKALECCLKALRFAEIVNEKEEIGTSYSSMASIYGYTNKVHKALEFEFKALKVYEEIKKNHNISFSLENIASHYLNLNQPTTAIKYLKRALNIATEGNDPESLSTLNSRLGQAWRALEDYEKAFYFLKKAEKIYSEIDYGEMVANLNFELGLTQIKRGKYSSAQAYLNKSEEKALETGSLLDQKLVFQAKSELYEELGDYKKALDYKEKTILMKDSLLNIESAKVMADIKTKYETEKKEVEIDLLKNEALVKEQKARQKNWILIASFGLLFLVSFIGLMALRQYKLNQKLKMERFRNKVAADLHDDVGSTLSSISMYSEVIRKKAKDKIPEAIPMLENMSNGSKEIMEAMSDIVWTINPKNNSLQSLIGRIKRLAAELCEAKNIVFTFIGDDADLKLNMEASQNIYLVLKESINNALKYSECTQLKLVIKTEANQFAFELKDNGKGFDMDKSGYGNGLRTMQERMKEVGGEFTISSDDKGTKVSGSCAKS